LYDFYYYFFYSGVHYRDRALVQQTNYGTKKHEFVVPATMISAARRSIVAGEETNIIDPPPMHRRISSLATEDDGGIASVNDDGTIGNEIYYLGVIDILQVFTIRKKFELFAKSITHKSSEISVATPKFYAERFLKFIENRIVGLPNEQKLNGILETNQQ
jgi:hypothetical protein